MVLWWRCVARAWQDNRAARLFLCPDSLDQCYSSRLMQGHCTLAAVSWPAWHGTEERRGCAPRGGMGLRSRLLAPHSRNLRCSHSGRPAPVRLVRGEGEQREAVMTAHRRRSTLSGAASVVALTSPLVRAVKLRHRHGCPMMHCPSSIPRSRLLAGRCCFAKSSASPHRTALVAVTARATCLCFIDLAVVLTFLVSMPSLATWTCLCFEMAERKGQHYPGWRHRALAACWMHRAMMMTTSRRRRVWRWALVPLRSALVDRRSV